MNVQAAAGRMLKMAKTLVLNVAGSCSANALFADMNTWESRRIVPGADERYQPTQKKSRLTKT